MTYLTQTHPGIGGQLKTTPEDFIVEEVPLYQPSGTGQHTYIVIEKRGLSTFEAIKRIASSLNIPRKAIGYAGLKDAQAITRQTLSLDKVSPQAVETIDLPNIKLLAINQHRNKLKIGHLSGNRFVIRVRGVEQRALAQTETIINLLTQKGVPNFFGEQRFGIRHNTHRLGETIIRQDINGFITEYLGTPQLQEKPEIQEARQLVDEQKWAEALAIWPHKLSDERRFLAKIVEQKGELTNLFSFLKPKMKTFFISACQSYLFNQLLVERLPHIDQLETGDIAYLHRNGAAFLVTSAETEQPRADSFEISPSGPLFGPKTLMPQGEPGKREQALLTAHALTLEAFKIRGVKMKGARRAYRIPLSEPKVWWDEGVMVAFTLPPGAYATTVLAEVMKS